MIEVDLEKESLEIEDLRDEFTRHGFGFLEGILMEIGQKVFQGGEFMKGFEGSFARWEGRSRLPIEEIRRGERRFRTSAAGMNEMK